MRKREIAGLLRRAMELSGVVGAQLSIYRDGEELHLARGLANAELGIPMMSDTVVQIGSVTKLFNALMIMTLVEEAKLDLDTPAKCYLPELELADSQASRTITLRHLLSMSSGLDNGDYAEYGSGEDAIARRVAALESAPQHFAPGRYFGYSNASTDVAGHIAERVTGKPWDALLRERVIEPAGLKNTVSLDWERMFQRVSVGHVLEAPGAEVRVIRHPRWSMPRGAAPMGGTLTASAHDLVRFGRLFLSAGLANSGIRLIGSRSLELMMTPQIAVPVHCTATSWCLGPCTYEWDGVQIWGHAGGNISGGSYLYWLPDKNGVMAWTINTVCARERFEKIMAREVMEAAFEIKKPDVTSPASPLPIDPTRYVGTYSALSGECSVSWDGARLAVARQWRNFANEVLIDTDEYWLIPLGGDRFLIDWGSKADELTLPQDLAFFGEDGQGRATNLLNFVWPLTRR